VKRPGSLRRDPNAAQGTLHHPHGTMPIAFAGRLDTKGATESMPARVRLPLTGFTALPTVF
jgi:hypothetical protein